MTLASLQEAQAYAEDNGLLFMETSAKSSMNVQDIFLAIGKWPLAQHEYAAYARTSRYRYACSEKAAQKRGRWRPSGTRTRRRQCSGGERPAAADVVLLEIVMCAWACRVYVRLVFLNKLLIFVCPNNYLLK